MERKRKELDYHKQLTLDEYPPDCSPVAMLDRASDDL